MDIYTPEGELDLDRARAELKRTDGQAVERRRQNIAELQTAALLDIASSLRPLAFESLVAAGLAEPAMIDGVELEPDPEPDFFVEGDVVAFRDDSSREAHEVIAVGVSEDQAWAELAASDGTVRVWQDNLIRLAGDEGSDPDPLAEVIVGDEEPPLRGDLEESVPTADLIDAEPPAPEDLVDDIDADFDGDSHPAAESALEVLKANEAARKAAKKKGKKS